jgi:hypothetical protein
MRLGEYIRIKDIRSRKDFVELFVLDNRRTYVVLKDKIVILLDNKVRDMWYR